MPKLLDMEELIGDIVDVNMKEYMREALTCYMTSAYRASVVMSFIAIFEDIYKKLEGLSSTNRTARDIFQDISKQRDEQKVYENDLINRLKSNKIISEIDADFLNVLRVLRNKAAHPSGHKPSAEEARYVFSETINRFLSKPILSTTQIADQIISKLGDAYLFPTSRLEDYSAVVNADVSTLHHDGYSYLINKLVGHLDNSNEQVKNNTKKYILGLSSTPLNEAVRDQIKKQVVIAKSSDQNLSQLIVECLSANHNLLHGLDDIVYLRLKSIIDKTINDTKSSDQHNFLNHPVKIFHSIVRLGEESAEKHFSVEIKRIIDKYKLSPLIILFSKKYEWVKSKVIESIFYQAGSTIYDDANNFAKSCYSVDEHLASLLNGEQCFELIVRVTSAANWGAFNSQTMRDGGFVNIPKVREKAINAILDNETMCREIIDRLLPSCESPETFKQTYIDQ
ncbi:hypothetical protein RAC65_18320 [Pantoea sp. BS_8]|uniref:hypothetical protein n=1 Tax=Pantoea sp. BS_8 TaxID=3055781 RepID=UPI0035C0275D